MEQTAKFSAKQKEHSINLFSNFWGHFSVVFCSFVSVPLFLRLIGVESYGVVGFFASIQNMLSILDLGFGPAFVRESASALADADRRIELVGIMRGVERIFAWSFVALIPVAIGIAFLGTNYWLKVSSVPLMQATLAGALVIMATVARVASSSYQGILRGFRLEKRVNTVLLLGAVGRGPLTAVILYGINRSILFFVVVQTVFVFSESLAMRFSCMRVLSQGSMAGSRAFDPRQVFRRFLGGSAKIGAFTLMAAILFQIDKMIVGRLFPAKQLGYYMVATQAAAILFMVTGPLHMFVLPKLSTAAHRNDEEEFRREYILSSHLLFVLLALLFSAIELNAGNLLFLWTHSAQVASEAAPTLRFLLIAYCFYTLGCWPNAMQISKHANRIPFLLNLVGTVFISIVSLILGRVYGMVGVALGVALWWVIGTLISIVWTHRFLKYSDLSRRFLSDFFRYVGVAFAAMGAGVLLTRSHMTGLPSTSPLVQVLVSLAFGATLYVGVLWFTKDAALKVLLAIARNVVGAHGISGTETC